MGSNLMRTDAPVVVGNPTRAEARPVAPRFADGTLHRFEMITPGGDRRVYADTWHDLACHMVPEYRNLPAGGYPARLRYARHAAVVGRRSCTPPSLRRRG